MKKRRLFLTWYTFITFAFLCSCQAIRITGISMLPNIRDGGMVFSLGCQWGTIHRGDIVRVDVINPDTKEAQHWIKRVIGLPKETVHVEGDTVSIDGKLLAEPYLKPGLHNFMFEVITITLAKDEYWVMGDNRPVSLDSRVIGPVKESQIDGKLGWYFQVGGNGDWK